MQSPRLPAPQQVVAPPSWECIDFISDLHLSADTPIAFAALQRYVFGTRADAIFVLGDLFDAWVGDDSRHHGFEAEATQVLTRAASNRTIAFMAGNRDFLLGEAMLGDCGVARLNDPTLLTAFGERTLLTHGDAWCVDDVAYQKFRVQVRSPDWQAQVLALPLAERREMAKSLRSESERNLMAHTGPWVDVDCATAIAAMRGAGAATLVHGHTHRPGTAPVAQGLTRHVLSDWELDQATAPRAEVLRWQRSGWSRLSPQDAARVAR